MQNETVTSTFIHRVFLVECEGSSDTIDHYQYTVWPDHGVPNTTGEILSFRKVRQRRYECGGSVVGSVVGVGRWEWGGSGVGSGRGGVVGGFMMFDVPVPGLVLVSVRISQLRAIRTPPSPIPERTCDMRFVVSIRVGRAACILIPMPDSCLHATSPRHAFRSFARSTRTPQRRCWCTAAPVRQLQHHCFDHFSQISQSYTTQYRAICSFQCPS